MAKKGGIKPDIRINPAQMASLRRVMRELEKTDKKGLSSELGAWALNTAKDASQMAPKKTGKLSQSYFAEKSKKSAKVFNKKLYAPYVEFGTGSFVDTKELSALGIPDSYALQFKGKGIKAVNLPARPHLFPSANKNFKILFDNIQKRIKNAFKK